VAAPERLHAKIEGGRADIVEWEVGLEDADTVVVAIGIAAWAARSGGRRARGEPRSVSSVRVRCGPSRPGEVAEVASVREPW
jgi:hypothetical protein